MSTANDLTEELTQDVLNNPDKYISESCPFCGGDNGNVQFNTTNTADKVYARYYCKTCGCCGPQVVADSYTPEMRVRAMYAWNGRSVKIGR